MPFWGQDRCSSRSGWFHSPNFSLVHSGRSGSSSIGVGLTDRKTGYTVFLFRIRKSRSHHLHWFGRPIQDRHIEPELELPSPRLQAGGNHRLIDHLRRWKRKRSRIGSEELSYSLQAKAGRMPQREWPLSVFSSLSSDNN
jgi:hypothetical protein